MESLSTLRQRLKQQRNQLSSSACHNAALALAQKVMHSPEIQHAEHIGVYLSQQKEIDLAPSIAWLWQQQKTLYLPMLHPILPHCLWFAPYHPDSVLRPNRYGILEPVVSAAAIVAPWELDVVLTPLLGFDAQGNRLGMGGGYYDRSFAFLSFTTLPYLIGCAYDWQQVPHLPRQPWDVALYDVLTVE